MRSELRPERNGSRFRGFWRSEMRLFVAGSLLSLTLAAAHAEEPATSPQAPPPATSQGTDWPSFLGPTGDSKSSERGILTRWPEEGPPLVWQLSLGTGYGMPVIRSGRLLQFDRHGDQARLRC